MQGLTASYPTWRGPELQQEDNVKCWINCWNSSVNRAGQVTDDWQAAVWDRRSGRYAKDINGEARTKRAAQVLGFLKEAGFSPEGAHVLDIGCGPGTLSLPLAQAGADVTALDISTGMLDRLRETARQEGLHVNPVRCSWWSADIDKLGFRKKFDLVVASMTPGVRDVETFDQMMACSKQFCYYSGFVKWDMENAHREIYQEILGEEPGNRGPGMLYPFMYLYVQGYRPLVQFSHIVRDQEQDWAEAAERTIDFLGSNRVFDEETKEKIRNYYRDASPDGRYRSTSDLYTSMMVWTVAGR